MPLTILFPHTWLEHELLERLHDAFGPLTLCQPWFRDRTPLSSLVEEGKLKIRQPPTALKPREDFHRLLSEYQAWMMENQGKGSSGLLFTGESGDETWAIRKAIRDAEKEADDPALKNTFKWHMVLHLAQHLEQERENAQMLLERATNVKSPLADAMAQEETVPDMFQDLPLSGTYPYVTERHLGLIFEAWFSLFGTVLEDDARLLTLDPQVMTYATNLFDGCDVTPQGDAPIEAEEVAVAGFETLGKRLPRLLDPSASKNRILKALSGRRLLMVE